MRTGRNKYEAELEVKISKYRQKILFEKYTWNCVHSNDKQTTPYDAMEHITSNVNLARLANVVTRYSCVPRQNARLRGEGSVVNRSTERLHKSDVCRLTCWIRKQMFINTTISKSWESTNTIYTFKIQIENSDEAILNTLLPRHKNRTREFAWNQLQKTQHLQREI